MSDLLSRAVMAHGSLDRYNQFKTVSADLAVGGTLWELKGQLGRGNVHVIVDLHQEVATFAPFKLPNLRAIFTPQRLAVETNEGAVARERVDPRAAFAGHTLETPWDDMGRLYFGGYTLWTYLTVPFSLTWPGFEAVEIEPWQEQNETWRRLKVKFPSDIASHCAEQIFYFDADGLLRRHDYAVEIAGNFPGAHYASEYQNVSGFLIPTRRRVFMRRPDNTPSYDELAISIDFSNICFA